MRLLVEIALVALLLCLGWRQPFRDQASSLLPNSGITPSRTAILAAQHLYQEQHPFEQTYGAPQQPSYAAPQATPPPQSWTQRY
jgi:hypothetical protein